MGSTGTAPEDTMKFTTVPHTNNLDKELYFEAARRVISAKCRSECGVDIKKYFNRDFYYNQEPAGQCYAACWTHKHKN